MSGRKYVGDVGKPLSPGELKVKREVPGYVYDAFNECIISSASRRSDDDGIRVTREDLMAAILRRAPAGTSDTDIYNGRYLDAANDYAAHGWEVTRYVRNGSVPLMYNFKPRTE